MQQGQNVRKGEHGKYSPSERLGTSTGLVAVPFHFPSRCCSTGLVPSHRWKRTCLSPAEKALGELAKEKSPLSSGCLPQQLGFPEFQLFPLQLCHVQGTPRQHKAFLRVSKRKAFCFQFHFASFLPNSANPTGLLFCSKTNAASSARTSAFY